MRKTVSSFRSSPLAERLNLHQRTGRVDVFDDGTKVAPAIGVTLDLQQVRTHIDQIFRGRIVDSWGPLVSPAVEQVHAA